MTDEPEILSFVRERFNRSDARQDEILGELATIRGRLAVIEQRLTALDTSVAHVHQRLDGLQGQNDRAAADLARIKRRLDLSDAPAP